MAYSRDEDIAPVMERQIEEFLAVIQAKAI